MQNYRKSTMINKKIVKTALKILLLAAGIASCVAAGIDSSRRVKEGEDETPATTIKSYSHTKQSLGGTRATFVSPTLPSSVTSASRVSATPHAAASRTATPVAASGSLYAVANPSASQSMGGGSGSSYASGLTVRSSQSSVSMGSTGATYSFRQAAKQNTISYGSTTVSESVVIDEPFSNGNNGIQRVVNPGTGGGAADPNIPEDNTPIGDVGALFVCILLYAGYKKVQIAKKVRS